MKILRGRLTETVYGFPCQQQSLTTNPNSTIVECATAPTSLYPSTKHTCSRGENLEPAALCVKRETTYTKEGVTYMSDRLGLHRIQNPDEGEVAVSLHLYTVSQFSLLAP